MAISGNQWQSEVISGNQWQSVAISGNQWQSVVISGHQRSSEVIRGHQRSSVVITPQRQRRHSRDVECTGAPRARPRAPAKLGIKQGHARAIRRHQAPSGALKRHQAPSGAIRRHQAQSGAIRRNHGPSAERLAYRRLRKVSSVAIRGHQWSSVIAYR